MNKKEQVLTHPRSESEEAALHKTEEYKLDSYFLCSNNQKWLQNKLADLEQDFIEIINNVPDYYPTILELCNIYHETGNRPKFREMLNYALKKFPEDDIFLIMNAEYHYENNDFAAARRALMPFRRSMARLSSTGLGAGATTRLDALAGFAAFVAAWACCAPTLPTSSRLRASSAARLADLF